MIGKYFNSGYNTKQLFVILMGLLVEVDEAQLMQLEDPRCSFILRPCSRSLCVVYALKKPPQFLMCQYRIRKREPHPGAARGSKIRTDYMLMFLSCTDGGDKNAM